MTGQDSKTILVVEDDLEVRRVIGTILRWAGYHVVVATTGEEGVQKVSEALPDLTLMDIMLPGIDGFEATMRIRRLPEGRHIPIIFLSVLDDVESKVRGLRLGGDDYITKPVKVGELLARVEARLRPEAPVLGRTIAIFGSKDNVGATTLAINLAPALHKVSQERIVLVDWKRPTGDMARLLNLRGDPGLEAILSHLDKLDRQMLDSALREYVPGVQVLCGAKDPSSASHMSRDALSQVLSVALNQAEYVLMDLGSIFSWMNPPLVKWGTGSNLCVLTPDSSAVVQAVRIKRSVNAQKHALWFILNRYDSSEKLAMAQVESQLGTIPEGFVPVVSGRTFRALKKGGGLYTADLHSAFSDAIEDIAIRIHKSRTCEIAAPPPSRSYSHITTHHPKIPSPNLPTPC